MQARRAGDHIGTWPLLERIKRSCTTKTEYHVLKDRNTDVRVDRQGRKRYLRGGFYRGEKGRGNSHAQGCEIDPWGKVWSRRRGQGDHRGQAAEKKGGGLSKLTAGPIAGL